MTDFGSEPVPIGPGELESFLGDLDDTVTDDAGIQSTLFSDVFDEDAPITEPSSVFDGAPLGDGRDGSCIVCGEATFRPPGLTKAGHKKRTPKYCDLHAPNLRLSSERPSTSGMESQLLRVQEELADDMKLLGTMAGPLAPVTGYYIFENADAFTLALLKLCKNNQRALRILHRAAAVAPVYEVLKTTAGVAYAVQVDIQGADPHNMMAQRLGVTRAYEAIYSSDNNGNTTTVSPNGVTPPPRYATIQ